MTRGPVQATLEYVASEVQAYYLDECIIQTRVTTGTDRYGTPIEEWVDTPARACFFDVKRARDEMTTAQVDTADAVLWIPRDSGASFTSADRVKLTKRFATALDEPIYYRLYGTKEYGLYGVGFPLKRDTGSNDA